MSDTRQKVPRVLSREEVDAYRQRAMAGPLETQAHALTMLDVYEEYSIYIRQLRADFAALTPLARLGLTVLDAARTKKMSDASAVVVLREAIWGTVVEGEKTTPLAMLTDTPATTRARAILAATKEEG